jgi:hypothetical protein
MNWDEVDTEEGTFTDRLEVPGGWLYRTLIYQIRSDNVVAVALAFVPEVPEVEK